MIKKQIIEISLGRSLNHYRVQQQISERYWREVVPMLEKAFDAISSDDELIEIDRFELDLGVVSVKEIEKESWGVEIKKKIQEKMAAITDPASSEYAIKSRHRRLGIFDQWVYYMDHGFLAWNTRKPDEGWWRDVLEAIAVDIRSHEILRRRIIGHPFFLRRVVSQHPDDFLLKLAEIITAKKQSGLREVVDELLLLYNWLKSRKKLAGSYTDLDFKTRSWQQVLESAAGKGHPDLGEPLSAALIRAFAKEFSLTAKIPAALAVKIPLVLPIYQKYTDELKIVLKNGKVNLDKMGQDVPGTESIDSAKYQTDNQESLSRYNSKLIDGEGIFIVHAGTILLHPFLKSLFSRLGLLNGNQFAGREKQVNSVALIHYLATGRKEAEEFELTLPKILSAFSLQEPIALPEFLPGNYIQEASDLLEAAISQWPVLKNTSPDGLREGFLQRSGKLYSKDGNLWLQVEKKSIDLLLDYLPWNLGIIKLPWLREVIRVEWR